jgi:hypothetical protein
MSKQRSNEMSLQEEASQAWEDILRGGAIEGSDFQATLRGFGITRDGYVAGWLKAIQG